LRFLVLDSVKLPRVLGGIPERKFCTRGEVVVPAVFYGPAAKHDLMPAGLGSADELPAEPLVFVVGAVG
jgi:hypothetical protein